MPLYRTVPLLLLPRETAQASQSPRLPKTSVICCSHLLFAESPAQLLSPLPSIFSLFCPALLQPFTTRCCQMCFPTAPLLRLCPGSTAQEKGIEKVGPYFSSHVCGAVSLPSYCSPVSSGQAPNVCTSSGSARGRPPVARAEC